jgi:hypothetical protein
MWFLSLFLFICSITFMDLCIWTILPFLECWLGHWGNLYSVLVFRGACCFQSFLFPCHLLLPIPCLLVHLLKRVYSFLSLSVSLAFLLL